MKTLRQRMMNDLEENRAFAKMARFGGYSSGAKLKETLSDENREIEKFGSFVKIVHHMYPDERFELMKEFSKTLNPNKQTARYMLEYLTLYRLEEAKKELIERLRSSNDKDSKEWAFVYSIDDELIEGTILPNVAIEKLMNKTYSTIEMKIFSRIVRTYADFDVNNLHVLRVAHSEISEYLTKVKNEFAKDSLRARFYVIESRVNLLNGNRGGTLESIFLVKSALDPIKSSNFLQYANSYLLYDYDNTKKYLKEAMEYSTGNEKVKKDIIKSMNFAAILHEKFEDYIFDGELTNELYYYCRIGDKKNAERILENIDFNSLTEFRKAFNCYYRGILYKEDKLLYESIFHFNNSGDKYWKKISVDELARRGVEKHVLEALAS